MAYKVIIDAGHGGYDMGASYDGRREKDDALRLALAVGSILEQYGIETVYTRTTDIYQNPNDKARIGNESGADLFVSLHRNSSPNPNMYSGVQTLIYNTGDVKELFANNINQQLEKAGFSNLGISIRKNLAVLRRTNIPSLLVEVGFINTDVDNSIFDTRFDEIAKAIADGILKTIRELNLAPEITYGVQVGLFNQYENALNLQYELNSLGYSARIEPIGGYNAVIVGNTPSYTEAAQLENQLAAQGYATLIIAL